MVLKTVFWTMFGMVDSGSVEPGNRYTGEAIQRYGYIIFGAYNFVLVLVLINMLIAMMATSFDNITVRNIQN